jgi:hypothetical protein
MLLLLLLLPPREGPQQLLNLPKMQTKAALGKYMQMAHDIAQMSIWSVYRPGLAAHTMWSVTFCLGAERNIGTPQQR